MSNRNNLFWIYPVAILALAGLGSTKNATHYLSPSQYAQFYQSSSIKSLGTLEETISEAFMPETKYSEVKIDAPKKNYFKKDSDELKSANQGVEGILALTAPDRILNSEIGDLLVPKKRLILKRKD